MRPSSTFSASTTTSSRSSSRASIRNSPVSCRPRSSMASWREAKILALTLALVAAARAEPTFYQARVAPILDRHCSGCHGETKQKAGLRVDSLEALLRGGEGGAVIKPGDLKGSELVRRINLPETD